MLSIYTPKRRLIMKKLILLVVLAISVSCGTSEPETKKETLKIVNKTVVKDGIAQSTFTVWGNCGMCKQTIEKSLKMDGVQKADWNIDAKIMTVSYDTSKISLQTIQQAIVDAGYDNVSAKGNDAAYAKLHECCQYERK